MRQIGRGPDLLTLTHPLSAGYDRPVSGAVMLASCGGQCGDESVTSRRSGSRTRVVSVSLTLAVVTLAVVGATSSALADGTAKGFTVTSTLDRKTVLPHRIHWLAFPKPTSASIQNVEFLIDGKVRWIERTQPYSYSDDGGYLVTSWLAPGLHRFTVRARTTSGRTATDTVLARVVAAPEPPAELAGKWQRDVAQEVPGPADPRCAPDPVPAGRWTLVFESRWLDTVYPGAFDPVQSKTTLAGYIIDNDWVPGQTTFEVAGSVTTHVDSDADPHGGWWCLPWGPPATYSWSVNGDTLSLAPEGGTDRNEQRGAIFTGTWKRVG